MPLRVYNTLTQTKEPFQTVQPGKVGMYVCGPTVYSPSHIGHMVGPVIFDTIKRYLVYLGYEVTWVVNITDVDDKLIVQAQKDGTTVQELAERVTARLPRLPGGAGGRRHRPHAARHRAHRRDHRDHPGADRQGVRLRVGRRRLFRRRQGPRIRQAQPPRPRGAAGRRTDRALGAEASSRRLRALEALQARRAVVGEPLGARPARLAHRVLGHEHEVPRAGTSTSTAAGSTWSSPTTRTSWSSPSPTAASRSPRTGCTTASDQGRPEDLQVRPRHDRPDERPARRRTRRTRCAHCCCPATIAARSTSAPTGSTRSSAGCRRSTGRSSGSRS